MAGLLEIGDLAGPGDEGPAIVWTLNGFDSFGLDGLRRGTAAPLSLHSALTLSREPTLEVRVVFESAEEARDFATQWGAICEHYTFPLTAAGLLRAFRDARWEFDHGEAILEIRLPETALSRMAAAVGMMGAGLGGG